MSVIQKFLVILILMHPDGSLTYEKTIVDGGCPPPELIMMSMNARQKRGEFMSWDGSCLPLVFKKGVGV